MTLSLFLGGAFRCQARRCVYDRPLISRTRLVREVRFTATLGLDGSLNQSTASDYIATFRQGDRSSPHFKYGDRKVHEAQGDDQVQDAKLKHETLLDLEKVQEANRLAAVERLHTMRERDWNHLNDLKKRISEALLQEDPQSLLPAFFAASERPDYLRSLSQTTFGEIIRMLDLKHSVDPYKRVHRDLHNSHIKMLGDGTPQVIALFSRYSGSIQDLMSRWGEAGRNVGITEYKALLNVARAVGDGKMARLVMKAMRRQELEMDTECYNYYFEARCWSNAYNSIERGKLRVIPAHWALRLLRKRTRSIPKGFRGHRTGRKGIKIEILRYFKTMVDSGILPDVDTYRHLMVATARDGDASDIEPIIRKVWGVDVDDVSDNHDIRHSLSRDSPLYPTEDLLFTIAHIYGINNDIPRALRIVDIFSRKYTVKINRETWAHLLENTFVLASYHSRRPNLGGASLGKLPWEAVENLWNIMVSEPYNIKPSISMWNRRIKSIASRQRLDDMLRAIRTCLKFPFEVFPPNRDSIKAEPSQETFASNGEAALPESSPLPRSTLAAQGQSMELEKLYKYRNFIMISHWVQLLFSGDRWGKFPEHRLQWQRTGLPNAVAEFWQFRPPGGIAYKIESGRIGYLQDTKRTDFRIYSSVQRNIKIVTMPKWIEKAEHFNLQDFLSRRDRLANSGIINRLQDANSTLFHIDSGVQTGMTVLTLGRPRFHPERKSERRMQLFKDLSRRRLVNFKRGRRSLHRREDPWHFGKNRRAKAIRKARRKHGRGTESSGSPATQSQKTPEVLESPAMQENHTMQESPTLQQV